MKKFFAKRSKIFWVLAIVVVAPLFSGCSSSQQSSYMVNLEIWGAYDDSLAYTEIVNQYKKINPYVGDIKYKKFTQDTYRSELLDALAAGQGPDIFMIGNSWLPSFENKLQPAPAPLVSEQDMKNNFPDVVSTDFMDGGKAYAVPLTMDSLELYYNKDMFNAAGITNPPKTWQEFNDDVKKLTVIDSVGNIVQSGAAIGTAQNVNRASDILSMLMFQNGVQMPQEKGDLAKFDEGVIDPSSGGVVQAGEQALGYYTQFAMVNNTGQQTNPLYVWNAKMHNSLDAFSEGTVAMMFNYSWQISALKSKNPKLNFGVAQVPQVHADKPMTVANYWGYAVSRNKLAPESTDPNQQAVPNDVRTHEAWQFLRFLALKNAGTITLYNAITKNSKDFPINFDPAADYLKNTKQPAARRDLIETQKSDAVFGPFAAGNLIAKSWLQPDPTAADTIFTDAIESVDKGDYNLHEALNIAKNRINYSLNSVGAAK